MGRREAGDADIGFGSALAAGDVDRDGVADLVVAASGSGVQDDVGYDTPGSVSVCYGRRSVGIGACTRLVYDIAYAGGSSLAVGNVSGDRRPEIVLGVDAHELNGAGADYDPRTQRGGTVSVLVLSGAGSVTTATVTNLFQASKGVLGAAEEFDLFGAALALGDLDRDGYADLVIGVPGEDLGDKTDAGRVAVVYGGAKGYRTSGGKSYDQGTSGIPGTPEPGDLFGGSLTLLDHDADGRPDLDIGAPSEGSDVGQQTGAVTALRGSGHSFTTKGSQTFGLGRPQVSGVSFGRVLGA